MERPLLDANVVTRRWVGVVASVLLGVWVAGDAEGRGERKPRRKRPPRPPRSAGPEAPDPGSPSVETNQRMEPAGTIGLPGRGLTLSWSPDGRHLAVGGRFREKATGLRYDTRIADVEGLALQKSFACHYFWVVATAWTANPYVGEVIADGGGDHMVKLWSAGGRGSTQCAPGQFKVEDGGIAKLPEINGWIMQLGFSPNGRHLAGASRDRALRVWQVAPGADQWKVVSARYEATSGSLLSLAWAPDGRAIVTGDRKGNVTMWSFDGDDAWWSDAEVAAFADVSWEAQPGWFKSHPTSVTPSPQWRDGGHRTIWRVAYAPDGARVAAVGADGLLSVYDARDGAVRFRVGAPRSVALHALDWSPDGATLAVGAADDRIYLFDATSGAIVDVLTGSGETIAAVAWSPDGRTLASTAGGPVLSVALHEAVEGPDNTIRLWTWR